MSQTNTIGKVTEFHLAAKQPVMLAPSLDDEQVNKLRVKLLREETKELEDALVAKDQVAVLDALTDLQYVLDGAYLSLGFGDVKQEAFDEVHRTNMAKYWPDGTMHLDEDGKVMKPPGWVEPDLRKYVQDR